MTKSMNNPTLWRLACLTMALFLFCSISYSLQEEQLKKKYAPILGEYEFDMSDMGIGMVNVEFYVEGGSVWAMADTSSEPGEMVPVEGKEFEFTIEDPDEGTYVIKFLKDDKGEYTKCHIQNEMMGMDVIGKKIK
ncbi:MAG: hypothetical protein JSV96_03495 [Candidatus Aminicenantes bacterium]|nr:MAG: hypothetical protein JSV96_03495 [Candidatus Aminicenantes bacterium]